MKVDIIKMPINVGCGREGAQDGPEALVYAGIEQWFAPHSVTFFDVVPSEIRSDDVPQLIRIVAASCASLRCRVVDSLRRDKLPVVLGGDHSLTWGSLAGVLDVYPDAHCVYVDAHGDFNTPQGSPSGNVHGMHMSFLMGIHDTSAESSEYHYNKISPDRLHFLATRALDPCEKDIALKHNLDITTADDVRLKGIDAVVAKLARTLAADHVRHVHLSFDIDAVDPAFAPATGVPEQNGLTPDEAAAIVRTVLESGKTVAIDLVEFNPRLRGRDKTAAVMKHIVESIIPSL